MSGSQRLREWEGNWCGHKNDNMRDLCGDGNTLYLDCVSVNILIVILYYSFARCTIQGNLVKSTWDVFVLFLTTESDNYLNKKF